MKRLAATILLGLAACSVGIFEPKPEPIPIEEKPVLTDNVREWYMYGKLMSREYKVVMPDGTNLWLKYTDKVAPKTEVIQARADVVWAIQKEAEANKPVPCTRCGGTGIEP